MINAWARMEAEITHVYPINDEAEHEIEGKQCWCDPEIKEDGYLIIHNSFDGRELFETLEKT